MPPPGSPIRLTCLLGAALALIAGPAQIAQTSPPSPPITGPTTSSPALRETAPSGGTKVLLVDDDESDNNSNPASSTLSASDVFYRKLLTDQSVSYDVAVVPRYSDGPPLEKLNDYALIVWYTGASYGGNRDNTAVVSLKDEQAITSYLHQGGTVLLISPGYLNNALGAGGAALWAEKKAPFLQQVLGIKGGRGLLQRFKDSSVTDAAGADYAITKKPTVETQFSAINPDTATALLTAQLDPDGKGAQSVPVAVRNSVGAGQITYVGFTFENITGDAGRAFAALLPTAGALGAGPSTQPSEPASSFSAKRASTPALVVTGTGAVTDGTTFVPSRASTPPLTVAGTGLLTEGDAFVAKQASTPPLTVTGTKSLQ